MPSGICRGSCCRPPPDQWKRRSLGTWSGPRRQSRARSLRYLAEVVTNDELTHGEALIYDVDIRLLIWRLLSAAVQSRIRCWTTSASSLSLRPVRDRVSASQAGCNLAEADTKRICLLAPAHI
jgi:hypothetical protein